jgi:hypothetical protein
MKAHKESRIIAPNYFLAHKYMGNKIFSEEKMYPIWSFEIWFINLLAEEFYFKF